jgi:hypothetical protein
MGDVLTYPGMGTNGGVPAPYLQNTIFPAGQGFGGRIALGMGRQTRRFADLVSAEGGMALNETQLQSLIMAAAQSGGSAAQSINYNFDGLVGPPGPRGPTIVQYLPPINGIGQVGGKGNAGTTGIDAFADIDIPIPYSGWEGAFTNNSPGAGSVAWASFKIKYKNAENTITAANTALEYLYWDSTAPTVITSTATRSNAVGVGKFLVGRNNAGAFEQSQFIKLITSGFISVTALSALAADLGTVTAGTIILNLGSTYRMKISPSGIQGSVDSGSNYTNIITQDGTNVLIQGTKIKALSVETGAINDLAVATGKIANSATKILTQAYLASNGLGVVQNTEVQESHPCAGNPVRVTGTCVVGNLGAASTSIVTVRLYYGGAMVAEDISRSLNFGESQSISLSAYVAAPSAGATTATLDAWQSGGTSGNRSIGYALLESTEDKGK